MFRAEHPGRVEHFLGVPADPSPLEEARAFRAQQRAGLTQGQIAARAGVARPYVNKRLALLDLDSVAVQTIEAAGLGFAHLYPLCQLRSAAAQRRLARLAVDQAWTVRGLERAVRRESAGLPTSSTQWRGAHPDAIALAQLLEDEIGRDATVPVSVRVLRGSRFEFRYVAASPAEARAFAQQLGADLSEADAAL